MAFLKSLEAEYKGVLVDEWPPYVAAVVLALVSVWLLVSGYFWGVYGGIRNWGDWFNVLVGLDGVLRIDTESLPSPLIHNISILDLCLVIGAFCAALLARQFQIIIPTRQEMVTGAIGGSLMGVGATLSMGCTIGGFFNPVNASSPAGWAMGLGLVIGAYVGTRLTLWMLEHVRWGTDTSGLRVVPVTARLRQSTIAYPLLAILVAGGLLAWSVTWFDSEDDLLARRGLLVFAGFVLGFVLHRSRFCFSRCFREPFVTGDATITKAVILSILIGAFTFSVLFHHEVADPLRSIPPTFWIGSLAGGIVFGIGMILAGGCASGSLWRVGEGHLKLVIALFFFAWIGSIFTAVLKDGGYLQREMTLDLVDQTSLGIQSFLPDIVGGWPLTHAVNFALLAAWYLVVKYNEATQRFTII